MNPVPVRWLLHPLLALALLAFVVAALWSLLAWELVVPGKG